MPKNKKNAWSSFYVLPVGLNDRILSVGKYLTAIRKQNTAKKKIANEIWKVHWIIRKMSQGLTN